MKRLVLPTEDDLSLRRLLQVRLSAGAVLMLPTDTIYGLSCRADSKRAIAKIFAIKRRPSDRPLLVLVSSLSMAQKFCRLNRRQVVALKNIWSQPRPTTVLLPHRGYLPSNLTAGSPNLAVRLPKSIFLRKMIRALGVPLVSTSANFSGQEVLSVEMALNIFKGQIGPEIVVEARSKPTRASRLVLLGQDGRQQVLRK